MVLEVAVLNIVPGQGQGQGQDFEEASVRPSESSRPCQATSPTSSKLCREDRSVPAFSEVG